MRVSTLRKWENIIQDFKSSQLSVTAYTNARGIPKSSFYKWSKNLGLTFHKESLSFIEIPHPGLSSTSLSEPELFSVALQNSKGSTLTVTLPWPRLIDFVKSVS
jgi:hypothetical protein